MPNKNQRLDASYYQWRKSIVERDEACCQFPKCGSKKHIEVHHIFRYADNESLRTNINNGITLCRIHHKAITGKEDYYAFTFLKIVRAKVKSKETKNEAQNNSGHEGKERDKS